MFIKKMVSRWMLGALVLSLMITGPAAAATVSSFSDVSAIHPNYQAINYLRENGVVQGYGDGTFGEEKNINRAEFLKIVLESTDVEAEGGDCYPDVKDEWFAPYVCTATEMGFVEGYQDGLFRPADEINFAEASKMVANVLDLDLEEEGSEWFDKYVYGLENASLIPANVSSFGAKLTRSEMAEIMWRHDTEATYKVSNTFANMQQGKEAIEIGGELMEFESCKQLATYIENNSYNYEYRYYDDVMPMVMEESATMNADDGAVQSFNKAAADTAGAAEPAMTEGSSDGDDDDSDYSETNVQVEGVDEADVVKTDGQYIYLVKGDTVRIVKATPVSAMKEMDRLNFEDPSFYPSEMYVDGDRLVVIGSSYTYFRGQYPDEPTLMEKMFAPEMDYYPSYGESSAKVYIFDISDKSNIEVLRNLEFEGNYLSSRKVDDTVYLVANKYSYSYGWAKDDWAEDDLLPLYVDSNEGESAPVADCGNVRYMPGVINTTNYLVLAAIPVTDAEAAVGKEVVMGAGGNVYASRDNLYVAEQKYGWYGYYDGSYNEETLIHKFALDGASFEYQGVGAVPGTILNQFSMDEDGEYFRIATTNNSAYPKYNNVYVLDADLKVVGKLEGLAEDEKIYSTRFVGDRLYMVTFKQIDPFFVIDLSEPTDPKVLGELKLPGVSDYLHPLDEDHVIGFGLDTSSLEDIEENGFAWYAGVKMSIFDVSDVAHPVEMYKEIIGDRGSTSELLYNHKALLYDADKGIMAFPVTVSEIPEEVKNDPDLDMEGWVYGENVFQGAYVYHVSVDDGFQLLGKISHYKDNQLGDNFSYYQYSGSLDRTIRRILYIGQYFYTLSGDIVQANEMAAPLKEVAELELAD